MSDAASRPPVLTSRQLNRTLLERQLLLERSSLSIQAAIEQVGGLQTQYAPSGYVGLWTRVAGFRRGDLTAALADRSIVQATLMRVTIHMVAAHDFWPCAMGVREARRAWAARVGVLPSVPELTATADRLREALEGGPKHVRELNGLVSGFIGNLGPWVDLVRVPPSGTWERRRADRLALAESWLGQPSIAEAEGLTHLVRMYLRAFGPAAWKDIAGWAGIPVASAKRGGEGLALRSYRDEEGRALVDLAAATIPEPDLRAPVRFLPHWDNALLVHARRTGILPEVHRASVFSSRNPFSCGTYLVDGRVVGGWSMRNGRVVLDPFEGLAPDDRRAVDRERDALETFHA